MKTVEEEKSERELVKGAIGRDRSQDAGALGANKPERKGDIGLDRSQDKGAIGRDRSHDRGTIGYTPASQSSVPPRKPTDATAEFRKATEVQRVSAPIFFQDPSDQTHNVNIVSPEEDWRAFANLTHLRRGSSESIQDSDESSDNGEIDYSVFCFGFSISGVQVTITSGDVQWGEHTAISLSGDTTVTVGDKSYVGVEFDGYVVTLLVSANKADFDSSDGTFRTWLCQFNVTDGNASIYRIGHLGNIMIPARYGN